MQHSMNTLLSVMGLLFFGLVALYYFAAPYGEVDKTFLTISTFLFAIFTGFFIARQGKRYSAIRENMAQFDGNMSAIYRGADQFEGNMQARIGETLTQHYQTVKNEGAWDYHLVHKSSTITTIHAILKEEIGDQALPSLKNTTLMQMSAGLRTLQLLRKSILALHQERVPAFQWILLYFLAGILLTTLYTVPSHLFLLGAILKAAFSVSILAVLLLLHLLDRLRLFEGSIGERSADDVIHIIENKR